MGLENECSDLWRLFANLRSQREGHAKYRNPSSFRHFLIFWHVWGIQLSEVGTVGRGAMPPPYNGPPPLFRAGLYSCICVCGIYVFLSEVCFLSRYADNCAGPGRIQEQLRRPGADPGTTAQARGGSRNFWRGDPGCPKRQPVGIFKWQGKKLWGGLNLNPLTPMDPAGHLHTHTVLAYRLRCNPVTIIWVYWPHTDQGRLTL